MTAETPQGTGDQDSRRRSPERDIELEQLRWSVKWLMELRTVLMKHVRRTKRLDRDLAAHSERMIADVPLHWPPNDPGLVLSALGDAGKGSGRRET